MKNGGSHAALDALFRENLARDPDGLALIDPPDIESISGKKSQALTYSELDARINSLAALLSEIGLPEGSTVAIQLPNNADSVVALIAVTRAGLVPALLPLLWRRAECAAALSRCHAKAIVCCGRVGEFDHGQLALELAAENFPIRAVLGFGSGLPDGIVPIDEIGPASAGAALPLHVPDIAAITFDIGTGGPTPVARNALQIFAAGLLISGHAGMTRDARLLSTIPVSSYAGLSCVLVPWLIGGGTLRLHHPFTPEILTRQIEASDILVVPAAVAQRLHASILFRGALRTVISLCRSPERFSTSAVWRHPATRLVDVAAFGEDALLSMRRPANGATAAWPLRLRPADSENEIARLYVTPSGTLAVQGALAATSDNSPDVDTGYPCRMEGDGIVVTAAPTGIANVGGYRFAMRDLQHAVRMSDCDGLIAALPHSITGHRLAGNAGDPRTMRHALNELGLGPLVSGAFRDPPPRT